MSIFSFLSGGAKELIGAVGSVIDNLTTTQDEKNQAKIELEKLALQYTAMTEVSYQAELATQKDIIVAELQFGDKFTKRARPSIIYAGLFMAFHNYCLPVWFNYFGLKPMVSIDLPEVFWISWAGVVGAYAVGRTLEKRNGGTSSKVISLATGAKLKTA